MHAQTAAHFDPIDLDSNGVLMRWEITAAVQKRFTQRLLKRFDANGVGTLSNADLPGARNATANACMLARASR